MFRNILNSSMIISILIVMDYRFTTNLIHEVVGTLLLTFFVFHNILNRNWYSTIQRKSLILILNPNSIIKILLLLSLLLSAITGILISQSVFPHFSFSSKLWAHQWHTWASHMTFILCSIHIGLHWESLYRILSSLFSLKKQTPQHNFSNILFALFFIVSGSYASFKRHIGAKLLLEHIFIGWDSASLFDFIFDYATIMGMYIVATHYSLMFIKKKRITVK